MVKDFYKWSSAGMKYAVGVVVSAVLLIGCSEKDNLAQVGDQKITQEEFNNHLTYKRIPQENEQRVAQELDRYIEQNALKQAIIEQKLTDLDVVKAEVAEFENQLVVNAYLNEFLDKAVNDAAIENYYKAHKSDYSTHQAHLAHIVFRTHKSMTEAELQAAQQSARDMVARLAKGEAFDELAREYSDDLYSGERGGDLGWLTLKSIDQTMASEARNLEVGQTSDVVKTQYGYHVLKLLSPVKEVLAPLKSVQGDIRYELRQKAKAEEVKRLLSSVSVKVNE